MHVAAARRGGASMGQCPTPTASTGTCSPTRDYVKHEGREEGMAEGMHIMLRDLAGERFGVVPQSVESLIATVDDPQARRLLAALMQSATPDEVLARMRRAS